MKKKVCFVIYNRSNYARLKPILETIKKSNKFELKIILTSSSILFKYGDLKKIIIQAKSKLRKGGMLLMENGFNQSYDVKQYLQENEYKDINILLDYNKIQRFTMSKV